MSAPLAARLEGVTKRYGSGVAEVRAVDDVSLSISPGELIAVGGPSGSGKSTLLALLGGLELPEAGRVWIDGAELSALTRGGRADLRRRRIGFVFSNASLLPVLTAAGNAALALQLQGVDGAGCDERVRDALQRVGLDELGARYPPELSMAQQQRVALARAVAARPAVIVADEPTARLDSRAGAALLDVVQRLNRDLRITFVVSTHDSMVMERAERIIHLHDGRVAWDELRRPMTERGSV